MKRANRVRGIYPITQTKQFVDHYSGIVDTQEFEKVLHTLTQDGFNKDMYQFLENNHIEPVWLSDTVCQKFGFPEPGLFFPFERWDQQKTPYGQLRLTHCQSKRLGAKYLNPAGKPTRALVLGKPPYIVVEGYKSAVALYFYGFSAAAIVGCCNGKDIDILPKSQKGISVFWLDYDIYENIHIVSNYFRKSKLWGCKVFSWQCTVCEHCVHKMGVHSGVNELIRVIHEQEQVDGFTRNKPDIRERLLHCIHTNSVSLDSFVQQFFKCAFKHTHQMSGKLLGEVIQQMCTMGSYLDGLAYTAYERHMRDWLVELCQSKKIYPYKKRGCVRTL